MDSASTLPPADPGTVERGTFVGPAGSRDWRLFVPAGTARPRRMLVLLHGCLQDAADIAAGSRMDAAAADGGFLVLYPEQPASANPRKCWNWFDAAHQARDAGEPAIIAGVMESVAKAQGVDERDVHLAGISAGAAMAGIVAVAYPERVASVSLMSGTSWKSATTVVRALAVMKDGAGDATTPASVLVAAMGAHARAVPILIVHGDKDVVLNVRNADEAARQMVGAHDLLRARDGQAALALRLQPERTEHGYAVREQRWVDQRGEAQVTLVHVAELGHAWSGGSPAGTFTDSAGPDASRMIAQFMSRHRAAPSR